MWKSALKPIYIAFGIGSFSSCSEFSVYGNAMSLLYGDDFNGKTDLLYDCVFYGLFRDCTELWHAANLVLPALNLTYACYRYMFSGCASLLSTPELPALYLADSCYYGMFSNCNQNLRATPELPALYLAEHCYYEMFDGCSKLNHITMLATDISAYGCLANWVDGVSSTGTFVKHPDMESLEAGVSGIPEGWTVEDWQ